MGYFVKAKGDCYRNRAKDDVDSMLYRYEESLAFEQELIMGAGMMASEIAKVLCIEKVL